MNPNDMEMNEDILRVIGHSQKLERLQRERLAGNLDDALFLIQIAARNARRRLRKLCASH